MSRERRAETVRRWSARLLRLLGVRLAARGQVPAPAGAPLVLVSNHVSWLDIFVIDALRATRFVAKSEVRGWPLLGWLAARTGTMFIERGRRHAAAAVNRDVAAALAGLDTVGLFPEGTTTVGDELKPFHAALFQAAIECRHPLRPVAIRYRDADGAPSMAATYVGDQSFVESLWAITGERAIVAEVTFGEDIATAGSDRRTVSRHAETVIARLLSLPAPHRTPETAADRAA
jgi:1-acyl-sn-glycerol-3-phosphate acyltransferase